MTEYAIQVRPAIDISDPGSSPFLNPKNLDLPDGGVNIPITGFVDVAKLPAGGVPALKTHIEDICALFQMAAAPKWTATTDGTVSSPQASAQGFGTTFYLNLCCLQVTLGQLAGAIVFRVPNTFDSVLWPLQQNVTDELGGAALTLTNSANPVTAAEASVARDFVVAQSKWVVSIVEKRAGAAPTVIWPTNAAADIDKATLTVPVQYPYNAIMPVQAAACDPFGPIIPRPLPPCCSQPLDSTCRCPVRGFPNCCFKMQNFPLRRW